MIIIKRVFCGGFLCRKTDRKIKCNNCKLYVCSQCSVTHNKKIFCIDCYVNIIIPKLYKRFFGVLNKDVEKKFKKNVI